jgi:MYXO-CTERM domain-containing protein
MKNQIKLLLSAVALVGFQAYGQNLVQNPGFETGDFTDWSGHTGLTFVEPSGYGDYSAHSGNFFVYFGNQYGDDYISQNIADSAGAVYNLSYWVAGDGSGYSDVNVYWDGILVSSVANPIGLANPYAYSEYGTLVTGTGLDTLSIGLRNDPSWDALDDVSVAPDAGSTMSMMALGLLGLGGIARRFRR